MTNRKLRAPEPVHDAAEQLREKHDYPSKGEAIRHVFREAGYLD